MEKIIYFLGKSSLILQQMNDILKNLPENDPANMIRSCVAITTLLFIVFWVWLFWRVGVKIVMHYVLYYTWRWYRRRFAKQEAMDRVMSGDKFKKLVDEEMKLKNE
jgi:hypothetical protein